MAKRRKTNGVVKSLCRDYIKLITYGGETKEAWRKQLRAIKRDLEILNSRISEGSLSQKNVDFIEELTRKVESYEHDFIWSPAYGKPIPERRITLSDEVYLFEERIYQKGWHLGFPRRAKDLNAIQKPLIHLWHAHNLLDKCQGDTHEDVRSTGDWRVLIPQLLAETEIYHNFREEKFAEYFTHWVDCSKMLHALRFENHFILWISDKMTHSRVNNYWGWLFYCLTKKMENGVVVADGVDGIPVTIFELIRVAEGESQNDPNESHQVYLRDVFETVEKALEKEEEKYVA